MSTTTSLTRFELEHFRHDRQTQRASPVSGGIIISPLRTQSLRDRPRDGDIPTHATDAIPDGGYGWTVIFACATLLFWTNGWLSAWGVLQAAMLRSDVLQINTSTISFVGSLALGCCVGFGLVTVRLFDRFGTRNTCVAGVVLMASGPILTSFTLHNTGGLFLTAGALIGVGTGILYTAGNSMPVQWFSSKLGLANGLVKVGGGLGATTIPVMSQALIDKIGLPWTFRVVGSLMFSTGMVSVLLLRERGAGRHSTRMDWSRLKDVPFLCLCLAGAVSTFALFVPPFFLPLFAHSIGLTPSTGAALVAGFGLSTTTGRLIAGFCCDRFGSLNTLAITMLLNAISALAIWPVSSSLAPLVVFAALNGVANGAFFVACPTAVAAMVGPGLASAAMSFSTTMWFPGYFMGSPIAGILIGSTNAVSSSSIEPYRAAIFYAGGVAVAGGLLVLISRLKIDLRLAQRI